MRPDQAQPLHGLHVVEACAGVGVRYCGRLMQQLGARVVQIAGSTLPANDDAARAFDLWLDEGKATAADLTDALTRLSNAPGRSLVIGGQTPEAVTALDGRLADRPGDTVRLGLTWFGMTGPYAAWHGHDVVIQALTGVAFGFGLPDGPPTSPQGYAPQMLGGLNGFIGALAALMGGQTRVDVSILEAALCLSEPTALAGWLDPTLQSTRPGVNRFSPVYPSAIYATTDGFIGLTAVTPAQWAALCQLIERPDLATADRMVTALQRLDCADEIDAVLIPVFAGGSTDHWTRAGVRLRIPITPATRPRDLPGLEHWRDRGSFAPLGHTGVRAPTLPFKFAFDGRVLPRPAGGAQGPLTGVRVADFSMGWAGPLAARYLGDLGADVLKIESAAKRDWWRGWEVLADQEPPLYELPINFMGANRSKRGLDLDLAAPFGKARAEDIIRLSDVVLDNQGPGVMDHLGLGQADQRRLHPGVISMAMPPFGLSGPLSGLRAYGSTVEHASGMPFINGQATWPPSNSHVAYGDPVVGVYGAAAVLAALYGRNTQGGAQIELCQVDCLFQLAAAGIVADQIAPLVRDGTRRAGEAPVCMLRVLGNDVWVALVIDDDLSWVGLCALVADSQLSPGWSLAERKDRETQIEAVLADWAAPQTSEVLVQRLQTAGCSAAPVLGAAGLARDPHLIAAEFWLSQDRRYIGPHITPQAPMRLDGHRLAISRPAPTLGEHTDEVLAELGLPPRRS